MGSSSNLRRFHCSLVRNELTGLYEAQYRLLDSGTELVAEADTINEHSSQHLLEEDCGSSSSDYYERDSSASLRLHVDAIMQQFIQDWIEN